jgi:hypothetical protein
MLKSPYCIVISPFKFLEGEIENSKFEIVIEDVTSVILINELSLDASKFIQQQKTKTTQDTTTFFKLTITRANDTPPRK